jgi:hypothetical protein
MAGYMERFELIAAFADGERVDTDALRTALADEAGRDYFIDLVAMREIVAGTTGTTATSDPSRTTGSTRPSGRALVGLAAALVVAVGAAGYVVGHQRAHEVPVVVRPPLDADVVVSLEVPPAPTHVIRLDSPVGGDRGRR